MKAYCSNKTEDPADFECTIRRCKMGNEKRREKGEFFIYFLFLASYSVICSGVIATDRPPSAGPFVLAIDYKERVYERQDNMAGKRKPLSFAFSFFLRGPFLPTPNYRRHYIPIMRERERERGAQAKEKNITCNGQLYQLFKKARQIRELSNRCAECR